MKVRKICILGGTGFVGQSLVHQLLSGGYQLRVLARHRERHREFLVLPAVSLVEADIFNAAELSRQFEGCDAVINLVGILNEKGRKGDGFRRAHVDLPRIILDACRSAGVTRLLHMSALNADAQNGKSHYLRSKGEGEDLVHAAEDMQVTSFRPSVIFGPGDSFLNRFAALLKLSPLAFPLACPEARFAPVYVRDVSHCFHHALTRPDTFNQRYDLCGPHIYSLRQLVEFTAAVTGTRRKIIALNDKLSRLQAKVLERVPGKPFSLDNYHSLQTDSVCRGEFPSLFNIKPASIEAIVPAYLNPQGERAQFSNYRRSAGRG